MDTPHANPLEMPDLAHVEWSDTVHHESGSKKRRPPKMPDLNIIPMLDVCFNLLVFFVLTASFAVGEGVLPAELPRGHAARRSDDTPQTPITITIRNRTQPVPGVIRELPGAGVATDSEGFFRMLSQLQHNDKNPNGLFLPDDPVIIRPDEDVPWDAVVDTFNQAVRARYTNIHFGRAAKP